VAESPSAQPNATPILESILHPTDFSEASRTAFYHALKAALLARSALALMHVSPSMDADWSDFPGVRETLERWGLLPPGSPRAAVPMLGIDVTKVLLGNRDPVTAVLDYLDKHPADMIVLAAHQREGRMRWLNQSLAEPIARQAGQMTLFLPGDKPGFVSADDGSVSLQRMLIPIAASPRAQPAVAAAVRLARRMSLPSGVFTLLHVGAEGAMPAVQCPEVPGWEWRRVTRPGHVIEVILETASAERADLIVMATDGRNGFLDALRGSHSERVLRQAGVPLLTVPVGSLAEARL
jgi:nucleotide-binding universal stress UspA family protein